MTRIKSLYFEKSHNRRMKLWNFQNGYITFTFMTKSFHVTRVVKITKWPECISSCLCLLNTVLLYHLKIWRSIGSWKKNLVFQEVITVWKTEEIIWKSLSDKERKSVVINCCTKRIRKYRFTVTLHHYLLVSMKKFHTNEMKIVTFSQNIIILFAS